MRWVGPMVIALGLACSSRSGMQGSGTGGAGGEGGAGAGGLAGVGGGVGTGGSGSGSGGRGTAGDAGRGGSSVGSGGRVAGSGGGAGTVGTAGRGGGDGTGTDGGADGPVGGSLVWRAVTIPGFEVKDEVVSLWGTGTELYAGTNAGAMLHRGASGAWTSQTLGPSIRWIWGSGAGDVYASVYSKLYHSNGDDVWTEVALPSAPTYVFGSWGPSASELFVAVQYDPAQTGAILHFHAGTWTAEPTENVVTRVWGSSATDLWAIGTRYDEVYRSKGDGTWARTGVGNGSPPTAVWGSGPGDVYVVLSPHNRLSGNAFVAHVRPDDTFALEHGTAVEELLTVWGSGPRDVYMAGRTLTDSFMTDHAVAYHSMGDGSWTPLEMLGKFAINRIDIVWGSSPSDVYMGGYSLLSQTGVLLHGTPN